MRRTLTLHALTLLVISTSACNESPPPKTPQKEEGVPANSLSDARLHGNDAKNDARPGGTAPSEAKADPTQAYTTKVGDAPPPESAEKPPAKASGKSGGKGEPSGGNRPTVSRNECEQVMDKYLELEVATNPQLKGVPREVMEQAKQTAREKHGEAPCTATHAQYTCAMTASSTAGWQRCMK